MSRFLPPAEYLARHGSDGGARWQLSEARAYTRWLARTHYENFQVVSFLLPRRLHQDFFNIYAFCRWADDLGDEIGDSARSLELLDWWRRELLEMYEGHVRHPVYVALEQTVRKHGIPQEPFSDLIRAFVQDQSVQRYPTYEEVLDYCRYSANPVGRLVLHVCGYTDAERVALSDFTCTALQLANFWQDVRRDWENGRVYIPLDVMAQHGYSLEALQEELRRGSAGGDFRKLMSDLVDRAQQLFLQGLPLIDRVDRRLAVDLELFSRGGLAVLELIRRQEYDVIRQRPKLEKGRRLVLLLRTLGRQLLGRPHSLREARHAYR